MTVLKNNLKYAKMFVLLATRTVEQLKREIVMMAALPLSPETALSKACMCDELESRIGEDGINDFLDTID